MSTSDPPEPPEPQLEKPANPPNFGWWRVFCWLNASLMALAIMGISALPRLSAFDQLDLLVSLVASVGLFGFAYQKAIGARVFWRYFFYVSLVESLLFSVVFPLSGVPLYGELVEFDLWYVLQSMYVIAILRAIYQYAYRSSRLPART